MVDAITVVEEFANRRERAGVFLDVDGTLAPIVARPELAHVLPEVPSILERLASHLRLVALISGRRSEDVRTLIDVPGVEIVGTHGLERLGALDPTTLSEVEAVAATVGAWVEPKGAAAAVHFRALPDPEGAMEDAAGPLTAVAAARGLELVPGKAILELMPVGAPRKGGAVGSLAETADLRAVLFAGDDVGDLDAFGALERLRSAGLWTCSVAAGGPEVSPAVIEAADLVVEGPQGVAALLSAIADRLEDPRDEGNGG